MFKIVFTLVRQLAFKAVETLLAFPELRILPGEIAKIQDLQNATQFNNQQVVCFDYDEVEQKFMVQTLRGGRQLKVSSQNLWNLTRQDMNSQDAFNHITSCTLPPKEVRERMKKEREQQQQEQGAAGLDEINTEDVEMYEKEKPLSKEDILTILNKLPKVHVDNMDDEHDVSANLLREMVENFPANFEKLFLEFAKETKEHFEHEEAMFREKGFGNGIENFSATKSHILDHHRILEQIDDTTPTLRELGILVKSFVDHVIIFDTKYTEVLGGGEKKKETKAPAQEWMCEEIPQGEKKSCCA